MAVQERAKRKMWMAGIFGAGRPRIDEMGSYFNADLGTLSIMIYDDCSNDIYICANLCVE